jgi:uncharacterized membrane protein YeaQ/YmgE (transglycosylase-associated protein family)
VADLRRTSVLLALALTTAVNAAFLLADPRLGNLSPWLAATFIAGGLAYVAAIPLCARRKRAGFVLAVLLGVAGAAVAVADNLGLPGGTPNAATAGLNVAAVVLAVPMAVGGVAWLRTGKGGAAARAAGP